MLVVKPGNVIEMPVVYRQLYNYVDPDVSITAIFRRRF